MAASGGAVEREEPRRWCWLAARFCQHRKRAL